MVWRAGDWGSRVGLASDIDGVADHRICSPTAGLLKQKDGCSELIMIRRRSGNLKPMHEAVRHVCLAIRIAAVALGGRMQRDTDG